MRYTVGVPSRIEIASLQEIKDNLRITHDHHDSLLCNLSSAAHSVIENYTGTALNLRAVTVRGSTFIQNMVFRYGPIYGDVAITYLDLDNNTQTLDPALYEVNPNLAGESELFFLDEGALPELYVSASAVTINYTAGFSERKAPPEYKQFVLLLTGKLYENPTDSAYKYHSFAKSLLFPFKKQVSDAS